MFTRLPEKPDHPLLFALERREPVAPGRNGKSRPAGDFWRGDFLAIPLPLSEDREARRDRDVDASPREPLRIAPQLFALANRGDLAVCHALQTREFRNRLRPADAISGKAGVALEIDERETEAATGKTVRDAQHVVIDPEFACIDVDPIHNLLGQGVEHQRTQQHEPQHVGAKQLVAITQRPRELIRSHTRQHRERDDEAGHRFGDRFDHHALQARQTTRRGHRSSNTTRDEARFGGVGRINLCLPCWRKGNRHVASVDASKTDVIP